MRSRQHSFSIAYQARALRRKGAPGQDPARYLNSFYGYCSANAAFPLLHLPSPFSAASSPHPVALTKGKARLRSIIQGRLEPSGRGTDEPELRQHDLWPERSASDPSDFFFLVSVITALRPALRRFVSCFVMSHTGPAAPFNLRRNRWSCVGSLCR